MNPKIAWRTIPTVTSTPATIRVVVAAPHAPAEVREIPNTLEAMQAIVMGYIEELPRWGDIAGCVVVVNEEGRPHSSLTASGPPARTCSARSS